MKIKIILLVLINSIFTFGFSQSIPSYWLNVYDLNDLYLLRTNIAKQIIVNHTGYYSSGTSYKEKWTFNFLDSLNIAGQLIKEGQLNASFIYKFNNSKKIIRKTITSKQPLIGWQTKNIEYEYEGSNIKYERKYNSEMELIDYFIFEFDSNNKPVKMSLYDKSDNLISYETAEYDDDKKIYNYKVFNSKGNLISEKIEFCNYEESSIQINEYGDLSRIKWPSSNLENNSFHTFEYKYDSKGNWTLRKWIILEDAKKKKRSITKRKIKYSE